MAVNVSIPDEMSIGLIDSMKDSVKKELLTEERIQKIIPEFRKAVSFYREYPDIYIDQITPPGNPFKLFFYQRIFLRSLMRYKQIAIIAPRAFSKTFISVLGMILQCVFIPKSINALKSHKNGIVDRRKLS